MLMLQRVFPSVVADAVVCSPVCVLRTAQPCRCPALWQLAHCLLLQGPAVGLRGRGAAGSSEGPPGPGSRLAVWITLAAFAAVALYASRQQQQQYRRHR